MSVLLFRIICYQIDKGLREVAREAREAAREDAKRIRNTKVNRRRGKKKKSWLKRFLNL